MKSFFIAVVAFIHFYILVLEMFLWTKPLGRKAFGMSEDKAKTTAVLAANQGLYNGFLAAGLVYSLITPNEFVSYQFAVFFLSCVILAAFYGAYTVSKKILFIQGLPAILALLFVLFL